jgi:two-component system sensor histidine kinase YesM
MIWIKRSLFAKLLVGMLITAIIPFSLSTFLSYRSTSESVKRQVIELNQNSMLVGMENVKRYLNELTLAAYSYYRDETLMRYLRAGRTTPNQSLLISGQVADVYNQRPEFRAVRYVNAFTGQAFMKFDSNRIGKPVRFPDVSIPKREGENWDTAKEYAIFSFRDEPVLVMNKPLIDYPGSTVLGVTSLYIGMDELKNLIRTLYEPETEGEVFLFMKEDPELIYRSGGQAASGLPVDLTNSDEWAGTEGSVLGKLDGASGYFIYLKDDYKGLPLTLVKFVPLSEVNESADRTLNRSLSIQLVSVVLIVLLALLLSYYIITPIRRLLKMISRAESGNFEVAERTAGSNDELGVLEQRFQSMLINIDDLLNREYRHRLDLSAARLKMLQAQINPHFLYNILQSIATMALRHGAEEINDKIAQLGAILRYSMDLQTEVVQLQTEIDHIEHYLSLQIGRFGNKLAYTLSCPPECLRLCVPKMVLQPLVENSIVHGFEKGKGSGALHIGIEMQEEFFFIRVLDNGKGMPQDKIEQIKKDFAKRQLNTG